LEKVTQKCGLLWFQKSCPKYKNNQPKCKNSPNLVTLSTRQQTQQICVPIPNRTKWQPNDDLIIVLD
jgi:hypothetical protein